MWCWSRVVTYVSSAAESDDQQQQWPEAAHRRRGGEALSPAATASGSPHPRPCRARRGEWTDLQRARRGGVQASSFLTSPSSPPSSSSLFSPSSAPRVRRGIKTQLLRGMQGGGSAEEEENKVQTQVTPTTLLLFLRTDPTHTDT